MTTPPSTEDLDEQIELAAGRRAPYAILGDWVALASVSPQAKALYWVLVMHVNQKRGDQLVWPSRDAMAEMLGFKKAASVDPYVAELEQLKAIEVDKVRYSGGLRARNRYIVHETPPDGYQGFHALGEFYNARKRRAAAAEAASETRIPSARKRPRSDKTAGRSVVRSSGLPGSPRADVGSPPERMSVVPQSGPELEELKPEEEKSLSLSERTVRAAGVVAETEERERNLINDKEEPTLTLPVAERIVLKTGLVTPGEAAEFVAWCRRKPGIRDVTAWLRAVAQNKDLNDHIAEWRAASTTTPAPPSRPALLAWCGECGDGMEHAAKLNPRFRTRDGALCPDCHPARVGAPAAV